LLAARLEDCAEEEGVREILLGTSWSAATEGALESEECDRSFCAIFCFWVGGWRGCELSDPPIEVGLYGASVTGRKTGEGKSK
jgi:hypothetical protein